MKKIVKIFVNLLTISRIMFSIFLIFYSGKISPTLFLTLIILLLLTDHFDGFLARKFEVQTLFGAIMDTLADKILCVTLIVPFLKPSSFKNLGFLLLIGELIILLTNTIATFKHKKTTVSLIGKAKMWVLSISIVIGYISKFGYISVNIFNVCCILTFLIQLFVIFGYIKYIKGQKENRKSIEFKKDIENLFNTEYYLNTRGLNKGW